MNGIPGVKPPEPKGGELDPLLLDELPREDEDDEDDRVAAPVLIFEYIAVSAV